MTTASQTLSLKDRIARAISRVQKSQIIAGMILSEKREESGEKFQKFLTAEFSRTVDGKTLWDVPYSTLVRWTNAGTVARLLGFTLDDEDWTDEDLPRVSHVAPLYGLVEKADRLEEGDARDAMLATVPKVWEAANARKSPSRLEDRVTAELAKVVKKKKKGPKKGDENPGPEGEGDSDPTTVVEVDPAALTAAIPIVADMIDQRRREYGIGRGRVVTVWADCIRMCREHGLETVGSALFATVESLAAEVVETADES